MSKPAFEFEAHPPERRRGTSTVMACGGCSCSCCCCLHAVGGLIGAATAPAETPAAFRTKSLYWRVLGVGTMLAVGAALALQAEPMMTLVGILFVMPALQIAAAVPVLMWSLNIIGDREEGRQSRGVILSMMFRMIVGAVLAILLMIIGAVVLAG